MEIPSAISELLRKNPPLPTDTQRELALKAQRGDAKARNLLVASTSRFVMQCAFELCIMESHLEDLFSEGLIGVNRAIDTYDSEKSGFLSYASFWIRARMANFNMNNFRIVKYGTTQEQRTLFTAFYRAKLEFEKQFPGRELDYEWLATRLNIKLERLIDIANRIESLDSSIDFKVGDNLTFGETLDDEKPSQDELFTKAQNAQILEEAMKVLTHMEKVIIRQRHLDVRRRRLSQLGEDFGVSRERVRQLEIRALEKLHANLKSKVG